MVEIRVKIEEVNKGFIIQVGENEVSSGIFQILNQDIARTYKQAVRVAKDMLGELLTTRLEQVEEGRQP